MGGDRVNVFARVRPLGSARAESDSEAVRLDGDTTITVDDIEGAIRHLRPEPSESSPRPGSLANRSGHLEIAVRRASDTFVRVGSPGFETTSPVRHRSTQFCMTTPRAKTTLASIPVEAQGLVLDHLAFADVLKATTTDRAGRAALSFVRHVSYIKEANLMPNMLSKLARCVSIDITARSAVVMERLAWVLIQLRHLRKIKVAFPSHADMSSWNRSCDTLARSMDDVSRIEFFRVQGMKQSEPLRSVLLGSQSFRSILLKLPLDCALETSMYGRVPYYVVNTLLSRGANPNQVHHEDGSGWCGLMSVLSKACKYQTVNVVRLLLEQGARSQPEKWDSFQWALMSRGDHNLDVLRLLYDAGLLPWTFPASRIHASFLHYLMDKQARLPISFLSIVKLVLERQPEVVLLSDRQGRTPLSWLVYKSPGDSMSAASTAIAKVLAEAEQDARLRGAP